jgi:hypothetical protein
LLSRIPAVKWAFNRLRPPPHSGSIDVAPSAADESPTVVAIAEAAPVPDSISAEPLQCDAAIEVATAVEPVMVEEVSVSSVEVEAADTPQLISSDPSPDDDAEVAPAIAEQVFIAPADVEAVAVAPSEVVIDDEPASSVSAEIEPGVSDETPAVVTEIEPVLAIDSPPVAEAMAADARVIAMDVEPDPAPESPAPKSPGTPKLRARILEPADRATLIRQRWAETGIRMWNPRLHGSGDATLNIQGRIELLPPEPGETMPRYDKLEFRMLGGQIVCEGVIVEAPVLAGQRSFTRLAEPRSADRTREPARERQAALA